jgi:serine/threonine-protein kinase
MGGAVLAQRYAVRGPIASGGFARLFQAEDTKLGRPVAIKLLDVNSAEARQRLDREARVTGSISHPNVCAVTDQGTTPDGTPFLVMELLIGETLAERFERERQFQLPVALDIAEQLLAGLDAAHVLDIVHRDVKPSNIYLAETAPDRFLVKLLDFGSAQVAGQASIDSVPLTRTGYVIGTAEYMSPEQLRGVRDFDARVDVYAAAVVIYEMITGKRPFDSIGMPARLNAVAYQKAPPLASVAPHVPRHLARIVDSALSTEREKRPARAGAFLMALRAPAAPVGPLTGPTRILQAVAPSPALAASLGPTLGQPPTPIAPIRPRIRPMSQAPTSPAPRAPPSSASDWEVATLQQPPPSFDDPDGEKR